MRGTGMILIAAVLASPNAAAREIVVPVEKGWKHAASGITLRQPLAGLVRNKLEDSTEGEFDVSANFRSADGAFGATIFIFASPTADAGLWFQRAVAQIGYPARYGSATPAAAPVQVTLPGYPAAVGFRQSFTVSQHFRGTSLAVVQIGRWLVSLRVSSDTADAAATDAELTRLLGAIGWPALSAADIRPLAMPADCADALTFGKAKVVRPSGADTFLSAILPLAVADAAKKGEAKEDTRPLCRDAASTPTAGLYRRGGDKGGYVLALSDAGRTMSVDPNLMAIAGDSKAKLSVTLNEVDGRTLVYASFSELPKPEQVIKLLDTAPLSSTKGGDITLSSDALK